MKTETFEFHVATKWGPSKWTHLENAQRYASELRESIAAGRESGDLRYHGRVFKRTVTTITTEWEEV